MQAFPYCRRPVELPPGEVILLNKQYTAKKFCKTASSLKMFNGFVYKVIILKNNKDSNLSLKLKTLNFGKKLIENKNIV